MIERIKQVAMDPMKIQKNKLKVKNEENEANKIEQDFQKISELLILGFGQAGCKIISHYLFDPKQDFDQIVPG